MSVASLVLDILVVLLAVSAVVHAARKGFAGIFLGFTAVVVSAVLALSIATPVSGFIFEHYISPSIVSGMENSFRENSEKTVEEQISDAFQTLPGSVTELLNSAGVSQGSVQKTFQENLKDTPHDSAANITENIIKPAMSPLLYAACLIVLFFVCVFILRIAAGALSKLFKLPVIGTLDHLLGGVLGIIKAAIVLLVFSLIVSLIIYFTHNNLPFLNHSVINSSYLYQIINEYNPFTRFIP